MTYGQGAYGLLLAGLHSRSPWLVPVARSSETLTVRRDAWRSEPLPDVTGERFTFPDSARFRVRVERDPAMLVIESDAFVSDHFVVHPYLSYAAAMHAHWQGSVALHAGVVDVDGRAWVLLADIFGGKTSLLAALAERGFTVLADDLAIIDADHEVRSGPRCVDLRSGAFHALKPSGPITSVRGRHRLTLGPAPLKLPLGGFVVLSWGSALTVERLGLVERSQLLVDSQTAWGPSSAKSLLDVLKSPFVALSRPRGFALIDETIDVLLARVRSEPSGLQR